MRQQIIKPITRVRATLIPRPDAATVSLLMARKSRPHWLLAIFLWMTKNTMRTAKMM
jgi:hypothetical protein